MKQSIPVLACLRAGQSGLLSVFLMIASLIWFLVNCSCSAVTSRLRLATLDDSCVSDRSVLLNDDSVCGKTVLTVTVGLFINVLQCGKYYTAMGYLLKDGQAVIHEFKIIPANH